MLKLQLTMSKCEWLTHLILLPSRTPISLKSGEVITEGKLLRKRYICFAKLFRICWSVNIFLVFLNQSRIFCCPGRTLSTECPDGAKPQSEHLALICRSDSLFGNFPRWKLCSPRQERRPGRLWRMRRRKLIWGCLSAPLSLVGQYWSRSLPN